METDILRVIVAGSRDFNNYELLCDRLDFYLKRYPRERIEIVSGRARGADRLGEEYAKSRGLRLKEFPANWDKFGKKAGYLRNREMAEYGTHAVIFWDGDSRGTRHMIELAREKELEVRVVMFQQTKKASTPPIVRRL